MYLCYDIKGIQRFIFSVPKLKCVIGASGLIDEFDKQTAEKLGQQSGAKRIFSGGGAAVYDCQDDRLAEQLADRLIDAAHQIGLDVRIGKTSKLSDAVHHADRLYPCLPEPLRGNDPLDGEPCTMSGLWPVPDGIEGGGVKGAHPLVTRRVSEARKDHLGKRILKELRQADLIPESLAEYEIAFFRNVSPDPDDDVAEEALAVAGQAALGNRNRWAVVAMDGNDLGRQFLEFEKLRDRERWDEGRERTWLASMSEKLDECTRTAFRVALSRALGEWAENQAAAEGRLNACLSHATNELVVPFRPLILGGDDVTLLCHSAHAMTFVREMAARFRELSRKAAQEAEVKPLWPATNGELSISAGILYAKVTFPLHTAIPYAESLLSSAKGAYRGKGRSGAPTPAAIDWDAITDTLVNTQEAGDNANCDSSTVSWILSSN